MTDRRDQYHKSLIRTPDQRLRVFISSTLKELADEREAAQTAVEALHLAPVLFELGARPHAARELYQAYLEQSDIFIGIYWQSYGWVAPEMELSGLEEEYRLARDKPKLIYIKAPAPNREATLTEMLGRIKQDDTVSYKYFSDAQELGGLIGDDLALLLTEHFDSARDAQGLPTGIVTFLFSDIEGSTRLWDQDPEAARKAMVRHDSIVEGDVEGHQGTIVRPRGEGDSRFAVFPQASDAVSAAVAIQRDLAAEPWATPRPLRVRIALHTGEADLRLGDYYGREVNRCARIRALGHGGQTLLSQATAELVRDRLPEGVDLTDLGQHRLKDLERPEHIFQLTHPDVLAKFPPLRSLSSRPNNLPTQPSAFIGRESELSEIKNRLNSDAVRLLTLIGPGGTGKTRLALQSAADLIDRFEDGVYFIDLAPLSNPDSVFVAIARTIGLSEASERPLLDELQVQLRAQKMLLLLDNFEQVTAAAPGVVVLLQGCPELKLEVTSREALHVRGEHLFPVPPLGLPEVDPKSLDSEQLAQYEAVRLFVERAQAVRPDFALTNENANVVAEICLRLDGLPLAIELASARIRLFSPQALRDRLGSRLKVLRGGARDLPVRQQALRDTIEWSYELLDSREQRLFELLSVFSSSTFESVEVVAAGINGLAEFDILDGLSSLIDKSLVRQTETDSREPRLKMLETIREYALERLEENPELGAAVRRAHAIYFAEFAQRQWERLTGVGREEALAEMSSEIDNLVSAWRYWVGEGDLEQLNKLVDSLWGLYDGRGWYHATVELTSDLLSVLSSTPSTPERVQQEIMLQTSLARALMAIKGYTSEVEEAYKRALELSEAAGELPQLFPVLRGLSSYYTYRAEFGKSLELGEKILHLAERQDDPTMRVAGHLVLGTSLSFLNDLAGGLNHLDQGIALFDPDRRGSRRFRLGTDPGVACFTTSALLLWTQGLPDSALKRASEALDLATKLNHPFTMAYALFHTGFLRLWLKEMEIVKERAQALLEVAEEHEFHIWRAVGNCLHGTALTYLGQEEDGLAQVYQGMEQYQGLKTPPIFWGLLLYVQAAACGRAGRAGEGLSLVDEALEIIGPSSITLPPLFFLLKGDLLLAQSPGDPAAVERCFRQSLEMARELGAKMPELQAAMRLSLLWREQGKPEEGRQLLSDVYETFTEGFTTADLIEAMALLKDLS